MRGPGGASTNDEHGNSSPIMKEAYKYGLRAITKARWDVLNEEYLVYKQSLVDEVAHAEPETHRSDQDVPDHERSEPTARPHQWANWITMASVALRSHCPRLSIHVAA